MPEKRYKVEGCIRIDFEAEIPASALSGGTDPEEEIQDLIEGDPVEFLHSRGDHAITYREDSVDLDNVEEMEPDWGHELEGILVSKERESIVKALSVLSESAKKKLVKELTGTADEEIEEEED